jgi:peptide/nickel transport system permease protein
LKHSAWRFLLRKSSIIGLTLIAVFFAVALVAPFLSAPNPDALDPAIKIVEGDYGSKPVPPGGEFPLGATQVGQNQYLDIYHSLVWGTRSALQFGLIVVAISAAIGVFVGTVSAYFGGWIDGGLMRITDAFLAFPMIAGVVFFQQLYTLVITPEKLFLPITPSVPTSPAIVEFFTGIDPLLVALILFSWMPYARISNSMVMRIKGTAFVEAARALGASHLRLIFRHLIPNTITPAVVLAARDIGALVLFQAMLAFIGLSNSSPWGLTLASGRRWIIGAGGNLLRYWWVFFPITLAIILFGIGWNMIGDNVNDWLNPHRDQ